MKLKTRLIILLGLMLLASLAGIGALQAIHRAEEKEAFAYRQLERESLCDQVIPLLEYPVDQFTRDYSQWDDLVNFVAKPDPEWARINLDNSLTTFRLSAICVLNAQGKTIYANKDTRSKTTPALPDTENILINQLHKSPFLTSYLWEGATLYALRAAPIQPSADLQRSTTPHGWLVGFTQVDSDYLQRLGDLLGAKAELRPPGTPPPKANSDSITRALKDFAGQTQATLHLDYASENAAPDANLQEMILLVALALVLISTVLLVLHFWILRPFEHITQSLVTGNPDTLKPILGNRTEIGHIARLVRIHFANQRAMSQTMEARAKLARDLHDGVIQSIYAAGMGVAAAQSQIETHPKTAATQLQQIRTLLNETIRETRTFISGLDSGSTDDQPFGNAVETLFESMSWIHKATPLIAIDETIAQRLPRQSREQALQIIRESISNSLRHGRATEVRIDLKNIEGKDTLVIADNGRGFDPSVKKPGGHGLSNLVERANAIGALATIDSTPGSGTRVTVKFIPAQAQPT